MIVMAAVDTALGLLFNGRRQSQDSVLRQHLLTKASGRLWLNAYSAAQFDAAQQAQLQIAEDFCSKQGRQSIVLLKIRRCSLTRKRSKR